MEWDELLEYVVQTVTSTVDVDSEAEAGLVQNVGADDLNFSYQPISVPQNAPLVPDQAMDAATAAGALVAQMFDDVYDKIQHFDLDGVLHFLSYRCGSTTVEISKWIEHPFEPRVEPVRKLKHGTALYSHYVLYAVHIEEAGVIASCSRQAEDSSLCANFYDSRTGALRLRTPIDYPALAITYSPCARAICFFAAAAGLMYLFDAATLQRVGTVSITDNSSVHAALSLSVSAVDVTILGTTTGTLLVVDDRTWKPLPGMNVLAHEYGVRALAYSDRFHKLISIGNANEKKFAHNDDGINAVLLWDISPWVEKCHMLRRERNESLAAAASGRLIARKDAALESDAGSVDSSTTGMTWASLFTTNAAARTRAEEMKWLSIRPKMLLGHPATPLGVCIQDEAGNIPHAVTCDAAGYVMIWNLVTGKAMQQLRMSPPPVAFPDGDDPRKAAEAAAAAAQAQAPPPPPPPAGVPMRNDPETPMRASRPVSHHSSHPASASMVHRHSSIDEAVHKLEDAGHWDASTGTRWSLSNALVMAGKTSGLSTRVPTASRPPQSASSKTRRAIERSYEEEIPIADSIYDLDESEPYRKEHVERSISPGSRNNPGGARPKSTAESNAMQRKLANIKRSPEASKLLSILHGAPAPPELPPDHHHRKGSAGASSEVSIEVKPMAKAGKVQSISEIAVSVGRSAAESNRKQTETLVRILSGAMDDDEMGHNRPDSSASRPTSASLRMKINEKRRKSSIILPTRPTSLASTFDGMSLGTDMRAAMFLVIAHVLNRTPSNIRRNLGMSSLSMRSTYGPAMVVGPSRITSEGFSQGSSGIGVESLFGDGADAGNDKIMGLGSLKKLPESAIATVTMFPVRIPDSSEMRLILLMGGPAIPRGRSAALAQHGAEAASHIAAANGGKAATMDAHGKETMFNVQFAPIGSTFYRHGMAAYSWTQATPPREGVIRVAFMSPNMTFATVTNAKLSIWDALSGRTLKILSAKYVTQRSQGHDGADAHAAPDMQCMCMDDRQRKIIIGDLSGYIHVVNPLTATVMKMLSPDPAIFDPVEEKEVVEEARVYKMDAKGMGVLQMAYAHGLSEVVSISGRGSVWVSEEGSLEGWDSKEREEIRCRRFHLPHPIIWKLQEVDPVAEELLTLDKATVEMVSARDTFITQGSIMNDKSNMLARASMPPLPPLPPGVRRDSQGGAFLRPGAKFEPKTVITAHEGDTPRPTLLALSVRLNLLAISCPMLLSEGKTIEGKNKEEENTAGAPSPGVGHTVLLYDYRRAKLVGALANPDTAPAVPRRASAGGSPEPWSPSTRSGRTHDDSATVADSIAADGNAEIDDTEALGISIYLLPGVTVMQFLDPLPALLTGHDDGSLRVWAVPPASYPFTCRMVWQVPDAVTLLPPTLLGQVMKRMSTVRKEGTVSLMQAGSTTRILRRVSVNTSALTMLNELGLNNDGTLDTHPSDAVAAAIAEGKAGDEVKDSEAMASGVHSRIPTATCAFAAGFASPMRLGSLAPQGHTRYMMETAPPPPAPDTLERVAAGITMKTVHYLPGDRSTSLGGEMDDGHALFASDGPTAADMLTSEGHLKFSESPCVDRHGTTIWVGDSDGEIHRWYISPIAFLRAGLNIVQAVVVDPAMAVPDEEAYHPGKLSIAQLLHAFRWSHRFSVSREHALARAYVATGLPWHGKVMIGEVAPPSCQGDVMSQVNGMMDQERKYAGRRESMRRIKPRRRSSVIKTFMPTGVCWEGSWRAHGNGDVNITCLSVLHETGIHSLLSGGNDGLCRVWDSEGRLSGTLDPQPKFQPFAKVVRSAAALLEADIVAPRELPGDSDTWDYTELEKAARPPTNPNKHYTLGPGIGSGLSFDRRSMTHVCAARVYDVQTVPSTEEDRIILREDGGITYLTAGQHRVTDTATCFDLVQDVFAADVTLNSVTIALSDSTMPIRMPQRLQTLVKTLVGQGLPSADMPDMDGHSAITASLTAGVLTLVTTVLKQRRVPGLRYGAEANSTAPTIGHVTWHVHWDLRSRYLKQSQAAREALASVSLSKMRFFSGFLKRSKTQQSSVKRLAKSVYAANSIHPMPDSYVDATSKEIQADTKRAPPAVSKRRSIRHLQDYAEDERKAAAKSIRSSTLVNTLLTQQRPVSPTDGGSGQTDKHDEIPTAELEAAVLRALRRPARNKSLSELCSPIVPARTPLSSQQRAKPSTASPLLLAFDAQLQEVLEPKTPPTPHIIPTQLAVIADAGTPAGTPGHSSHGDRRRASAYFANMAAAIGRQAPTRRGSVAPPLDIDAAESPRPSRDGSQARPPRPGAPVFLAPLPSPVPPSLPTMPSRTHSGKIDIFGSSFPLVVQAASNMLIAPKENPFSKPLVRHATPFNMYLADHDRETKINGFLGVLADPERNDKVPELREREERADPGASSSDDERPAIDPIEKTLNELAHPIFDIKPAPIHSAKSSVLLDRLKAQGSNKLTAFYAKRALILDDMRKSSVRLTARSRSKGKQ
jgi:hypothetical protein